MKNWLVLAAGFLVISAGLIFAGEPKVPSVAFTLVAPSRTFNSGSPGILFRLAGTTTNSGEVGYLEDMNTTALGWEALSNGTGSFNTAIGCYTLYSNIDGIYNTAVGNSALYNNASGQYNAAYGYAAGSANIEGSYNIYLGASVHGSALDTNTIRIGVPYNSTVTPPWGQNQTYIAGIIDTQFTEAQNPTVVGITQDGRLGTMSDDLLPSKGDQGPPGPQGVQGPAGEGLVAGSLLFLRIGIAPPSGYELLGTTNFSLTTSGSKKATVVTVNVYQKQ